MNDSIITPKQFATLLKEILSVSEVADNADADNVVKLSSVCKVLKQMFPDQIKEIDTQDTLISLDQTVKLLKKLKDNLIYTVTISYNGNGATSGSPMVDQVNVRDSVIVRDKGSFDKGGFVFLGWSLDSNASEPDPNYMPGMSFTATKDIIFQAIWGSDH